MLAYFNDEKIKQKYLDRVKFHREADNLIQGVGWDDGKGCAVGCTLENYNHAQYEIELGIPQMLARLEDCIFEGLPKEKAMLWPERFLTSIPVGKDLSKVGIKFLLAINKRNRGKLYSEFNNSIGRPIDQVIEVLENWLIDKLDISAAESAAWSAVRSAAESAVRSAAESAVRSAARSAESAAWSAESAAWSAWSADSAAWSAMSAAASAASAAESTAWSAWSADSAAWSAMSAEYEWMADLLIDLIQE